MNDYVPYPAKAAIAHNAGAAPMGEESSVDVENTMLMFSNDKALSTYAMPDGTLPFSTKIKYMTNTNYVAVYWSGLPQG